MRTLIAVLAAFSVGACAGLIGLAEPHEDAEDAAAPADGHAPEAASDDSSAPPPPADASTHDAYPFDETWGDGGVLAVLTGVSSFTPVPSADGGILTTSGASDEAGAALLTAYSANGQDSAPVSVPGGDGTSFAVTYLNEAAGFVLGGGHTTAGPPTTRAFASTPDPVDSSVLYYELGGTCDVLSVALSPNQTQLAASFGNCTSATIVVKTPTSNFPYAFNPPSDSIAISGTELLGVQPLADGNLGLSPFDLGNGLAPLGGSPPLPFDAGGPVHAAGVSAGSANAFVAAYSVENVGLVTSIISVDASGFQVTGVQVPISGSDVYLADMTERPSNGERGYLVGGCTGRSDAHTRAPFVATLDETGAISAFASLGAFHEGCVVAVRSDDEGRPYALIRQYETGTEIPNEAMIIRLRSDFR